MQHQDTTINFKQCTADLCIFVTGEEADLTIVAVYNYYLIVITETMKKIKESLAARFKMKDLGKLHYCLGNSIQHDEEKECYEWTKDSIFSHC